MKKQLTIALWLAITVVSCPPPAPAQTPHVASQNVPIPSWDSLKKVSAKAEITPQESSNRTYTLATREHRAIGDAYVIVTDQHDDQYLGPLKKLADFHQGKVIQVKDLADLCTIPAARLDLRRKLLAAGPKYVALAPTMHTYQENVLLAFLQILDNLKPEPGLDAFPAVLVAPDAVSFNRLIERSINYKPTKPKPFVVAQITDCGSFQRSLQKLRIMRKYFDSESIACSGLLVRAFKSTKCQENTPTQDGEFEVSQERPGKLVPAVGQQAEEAIRRSNLLIMFGHGVPGMTCSLNVDALAPIDLRNKIFLSGSCYSAAALFPDLGIEKVGIDGSPVEQNKERVFQRAIANGAVVFLGHMRENGGFPAVSTFLTGLADGLSVGESYQRMINAHLAMCNFPTDNLIIPPAQTGDQKVINSHIDLLYMVIGDPALCPYPQGIHNNK